MDQTPWSFDRLWQLYKESLGFHDAILSASDIDALGAVTYADGRPVIQRVGGQPNLLLYFPLWLLDDGTYLWQLGGRDWHVGMAAFTTAERFRCQAEFEPLLNDINEAIRTLSLARRWSIVECVVNAETAGAARSKLRGLTADA